MYLFDVLFDRRGAFRVIASRTTRSVGCRRETDDAAIFRKYGAPRVTRRQ